MIDFLKDHPYLYNKKLDDYKNKEKKDAAWKHKLTSWKEQSRALKLSTITQFGRLKPKSSSGADQWTDCQKWLYEHFAFLAPHITRYHKRSMGNVPKPPAPAPSMPDLPYSGLPWPPHFVILLQLQYPPLFNLLLLELLVPHQLLPKMW